MVLEKVAFRLRTPFVVVIVLAVSLACLAWLTRWLLRQWLPERMPDAVFIHDTYLVVGNGFDVAIGIAFTLVASLGWLYYRANR